MTPEQYRLRARLLAVFTGFAIALACGLANAEFTPRPEYRSIIATDPEVSQRFAYLLSEHRPRIDEVAQGIYLARGFGQGSAVMVEGDEGVAIFDVGDSYEHAQAMLTAFRKHSDKPIVAVIYSHYHFDHIFGGKAWVDAAGKEVKIIGHDSIVRFLDERVSALAPRTDWGLAMQFGLYLDESCAVGTGPLCSGVHGIQFPRVGSTKGQQRHVIYPNTTFRDRMTLDLGNLEIELIHSPSETPDNILLWVPERKTVLTGDSLTPTLPPIFTARGQRVRDPEAWIASIDLMRSLEPEHVVPSHGPSFSGDMAAEVLQNYRDAIAFMYHQTVRLINRGLGPEEIAAQLELPAHLQRNPLLGQWYNDLQTDIRGIYSYLVGHYGDVAEMPLLAPDEADRNMIALAGGPEPYLEKLQAAHERGDHAWVARAASHLIRVEPQNQAAKNLKASSLRVLAGRTPAGSHRHFYLQHAAALEGLIEIPVAARFREEDVATVPVSALARQLPFRLNAKRAMGVTDSFSIAISDTGDKYAVSLRSGVAEVQVSSSETADLTMDSASFRLLYIGQMTLAEGFTNDRISGDPRKSELFMSYFDWPG